jgi:hypothetical protein
LVVLLIKEAVEPAGLDRRCQEYAKVGLGSTESVATTAILLISVGRAVCEMVLVPVMTRLIAMNYIL